MDSQVAKVFRKTHSEFYKLNRLKNDEKLSQLPKRKKIM